MNQSDPNQHWYTPEGNPSYDGWAIEMGSFYEDRFRWNAISSGYPRSRICRRGGGYTKASNGKYYMAHRWRTNAKAAAQVCQEDGASLAMAYSVADYAALLHFRLKISLSGGFDGWWVAGTDAVTEGKWIMPNGW